MAGKPHRDGTAAPFQIAFDAYGRTIENPPTPSQVRSVRRALLGLQRAGQVQRVSHGRYALTEPALVALMAWRAVLNQEEDSG